MDLSAATARQMSAWTGLPGEYCEVFLKTMQRLAPAGSDLTYGKDEGVPMVRIVYPDNHRPWHSAILKNNAEGSAVIHLSTSDRILVVRESRPSGARRGPRDVIVSLDNLSTAIERTLNPQLRRSGRR